MNALEKLKSLDLSKIENEKLRDTIKKNIDQFKVEKATEAGWDQLKRLYEMVEAKFPAAIKKEEKKDNPEAAKAAAKSDMKKERPAIPDWSGTKWEDDVYDKLGELLESSRGDAQGVAEAAEIQSNSMTKAYNKKLSAKKTAEMIADGKEIEEVKEKAPAKEKKEPKPEPEPKKEHTRKPQTKYGIKEGAKEQEVSKGLKLHMVKEGHYAMDHNGKTAFDFVKKDGKWMVECADKKNKSFNSLQGAVNYVAKTLDKGASKEVRDQKIAAAKRAAKFRKNNPSGETTPAKTMTKAVEKTVEKLKEKEEKGESTDKQQEAIINQILELLKMLSPEYIEKLKKQL